MQSDSMVVEDGAGETRTRPGDRSSWLLVAVGFGLGLALGSIIAAPRLDPVPQDDLQVVSPVTTVGERDETLDSGVAGAVPGFPDALVAVGAEVGSGYDYLLWPVGGPLITRSLTGGSDLKLDATGHYVALSQTVPDVPGALLTMGRFNGIRSVATGVTSYEWNDSETGELAYTIQEDGGWELYRVTGNFNPSVVAQATGEGASVAAWGQWGYAIQLPGARVQLLTSAGEPKDTESGVVLASHGSGWILVQDEGLELVSAGGGVRRLEHTEVPAEILAAAFSPNGSSVALAGRAGVVVLDLDEPEEIFMAPGFAGNWVAWSTDSRFVVGPARRGVFIHDLEDETSHQVLVDHSILDAQVLPLSTS
jgi:hypothetical protein